MKPKGNGQQVTAGHFASKGPIVLLLSESFPASISAPSIGAIVPQRRRGSGHVEEFRPLSEHPWEVAGPWSPVRPRNSHRKHSGLNVMICPGMAATFLPPDAAQKGTTMACQHPKDCYVG